MKTTTTVLELLGIVAIVAGLAVAGVIPAALLVGGVALIGSSYLITSRRRASE